MAGSTRRRERGPSSCPSSRLTRIAGRCSRAAGHPSLYPSSWPSSWTCCCGSSSTFPSAPWPRSWWGGCWWVCRTRSPAVCRTVSSTLARHTGTSEFAGALTQGATCLSSSRGAQLRRNRLRLPDPRHLSVAAGDEEVVRAHAHDPQRGGHGVRGSGHALRGLTVLLDDVHRNAEPARGVRAHLPIRRHVSAREANRGERVVVIRQGVGAVASARGPTAAELAHHQNQRVIEQRLARLARSGFGLELAHEARDAVHHSAAVRAAEAVAEAVVRVEVELQRDMHRGAEVCLEQAQREIHPRVEPGEG